MRNHSRLNPDVYKAPERTLEIAGPALPRWTPPYIDMLAEGKDTRPYGVPHQHLGTRNDMQAVSLRRALPDLECF